MPTLEQLRSFLDSGFGAVANAFALPRGTVAVPTPEIDRVIDAVLGSGNALTLTSATRPQITGAIVRVTGTGSGGPIGALSVSIDFSVSAANQTAHMVLTATAPNGFTFKDRFPSPGPATSVPALYAALKASSGAKLTLSSLAERGKELLFEGGITVDQPAGADATVFTRFGAQLLGGAFSGQVTGPIQMARDNSTPPKVFPVLDLSPSTTTTVSIALDLIHFNRASLGFATEVSRNDKNERVLEASLKLVSSMQFNVGAHSPIAITAEASDFSAPVEFAGDLNEFIPVQTVADLVSVPTIAANTASNVTTATGVAVEPQLRWKKVGFKVQAKASQLEFQSVSFGLESAKAWNVIENDITHAAIGVQKLFVKITVFPAGSSPRAQLTCGGTLQAGQALLDVESSPRNLDGTTSPPFSVSVALSGNPALKLSDVLQLFRAGDRAGAADLAVDSFKLDITPAQKTYSGLIKLLGVWQMPGTPGPKGLGLGSLKLNVDYESKKTWAVKLNGDVQIGDLKFNITADHPSGATEWVFKSSVGTVAPVSVTDMAAKIYGHFALTTPTMPVNFGVKEAGIEIRTGTADLTFRMKGEIALDAVNAPFTLSMKMSNAKGVYRETFEGQLDLAVQKKDSPQKDLFSFDVIFDRQSGTNRFAASLKGGTGATVTLAGIVQSFTTKTPPAGFDAFSLSLKESVFLFQPASGTGASAKAAKCFIAASMGTGVSLSGLPLVGQFFDKASLSLQIIPKAATEDFTRGEIEAFRGLLTQKAALLPGRTDGDANVVVVGKGSTIDMKTSVNGTLINLPLPLTISPQGKVDRPAPAAGENPNDPVFVKVQNTFGPVTVSRVGVKFVPSTAPGSAGTMTFVLDAAMALGPASVSLDGLSVSSTLDTFLPSFGLKGLGLRLTQGPVDIGGAFLPSGSDFAGAAVIRFQQTVINAFGAYSQVDQHASLFLYAILNYPIGGPSFFFVTGVAAGFGINRKLIAPEVQNVRTFTMVRDASADSAGPLTNTAAQLTAKINAMRNEIRPSVGDFFLAAGIRFTSFKLVDSFVLLTAQFGRTFEFNLLGISKAVIPPPESGKPPLAEVELALRAVVRPDEGFIGVDAQLTPASYLFSRDCTLRGGFGFYCWFKDQPGRNISAGDFVLSIGGYHPNFIVPAHYPRPPRVGFDWRVDSTLQLHGNAYFALTPSLLMAGGELQATYNGSSIQASFTVGADFLLAWKPYHYRADFHVSASVSITWWFFGTHVTTLEVGADVTIFGPPFGGRGTARALGISHDFTFGAPEQPVVQLTLDEFKKAFLPVPPDNAPANTPDKVLTVSVLSGLLRQSDSATALGLLDPATLMISVESAVPVTNLVSPVQPPAATNPLMRLAPVAGAPPFTSTLTLTLTASAGASLAGFQSIRVLKSVPAALWGLSGQVSLNGARLVNGATCGVKFSAAPVQVTGGHTVSVPAPTPLTAPGSARLAVAVADSSLAPNLNEISLNLRSAGVAATRSAILAAVGILDADRLFDIDGSIQDEFLEPPAQVRLQS